MTRTRWLLLAGYVIAALVATYFCAVAQQCNNFAIYRSAFANLTTGRNLYGQHPDQHWDLFKYSPTFALLIAPFSALPFGTGLLLFQLVSVLALFVAIHRLFPGKNGELALALVLLSFVASTDGSQVNPLLCALMILAFIAMERGDLRGDAVAALLIGAGVMTKIFPIAAATMAVRSDGHAEWRLPRPARFLIVLGVTLFALVTLPVLVTSGAALVQQYHWWYAILRHDVRATGVSLLETLAWLGYRRGNALPEVLGVAALLLPLTVLRAWEATRRRLFLCSILIYVVLFNPQAERPSFIFALVGIAIWFVASERGRVRTTLTLATAAVLPLAMAADISVGHLGTWKHAPLQLLVVCCAAAWIAVQVDLWGVDSWAAARAGARIPRVAIGLPPGS